MKNVRFRLKNIVLCLAALCLAAIAVIAQGPQPQGPPSPPDPLGRLKHALTEAGAPALSTQQEQQLTQVIEAARANRPEGPSDAMEAARRAYDGAILSGNLSAANAQAAIIAQQISVDATAHLQAEAKLAIDALNVLKSNPNQISALTQRFGTDGLAHLLHSLTGPGRPGGPGGPGRPEVPPPPPPNGERGPGRRP